MRHLSTQRGLTLIELMVGPAIGAFLMLTAVPCFSECTHRSRPRKSGDLAFSVAIAIKIFGMLARAPAQSTESQACTTALQDAAERACTASPATNAPRQCLNEQELQPSQGHTQGEEPLDRMNFRQFPITTGVTGLQGWTTWVQSLVTKG